MTIKIADGHIVLDYLSWGGTRPDFRGAVRADKALSVAFALHNGAETRLPGIQPGLLRLAFLLPAAGQRRGSPGTKGEQRAPSHAWRPGLLTAPPHGVLRGRGSCGAGGGRGGPGRPRRDSAARSGAGAGISCSPPGRQRHRSPARRGAGREEKGREEKRREGKGRGGGCRWGRASHPPPSFSVPSPCTGTARPGSSAPPGGEAGTCGGVGAAEPAPSPGRKSPGGAAAQRSGTRAPRRGTAPAPRRDGTGQDGTGGGVRPAAARPLPLHRGDLREQASSPGGQGAQCGFAVSVRVGLGAELHLAPGSISQQVDQDSQTAASSQGN
eukprot:XP_027302526.1 uncharacterized protein LOC113840206 [Anas platyrhynchos]